MTSVGNIVRRRRDCASHLCSVGWGLLVVIEGLHFSTRVQQELGRIFSTVACVTDNIQRDEADNIQRDEAQSGLQKKV